MTLSSLFQLSLRFAVAGSLSIALFVPFYASAASVVVGSIDVWSLVSTSSRPTLSGLAFGAKTVRVVIRKEGSTKTFFKSDVLPVRDNVWKFKVSKNLSKGTYNVELLNIKGVGFINAPSGVLTIGTTSVATAPKSTTTLAVGPISLLVGGIARAGTTLPVSYLQITNTGKEPVSLKGFWVTQNGSAPTQSVIALSTVDDTGGSRGTVGGTEGLTPFKNGMAFVPTNVLFAPGQMRLFTIKAILAGNIASYLGTQLKIDVTAVETSATTQGTFPIRGTTWIIQ